MSGPVTPAEAPSGPRRSRLGTYLLAVALVGIGAVLGSAVTVVVVTHRVLRGLAHPELAPASIAAHLERRLRLTPTQTREVEATLRERQASLVRIRRRVEPELEAELDRTRREVAAHLEPQQAERWYRIFDRLRVHVLPPLAPAAEPSPPPGG